MLVGSVGQEGFICRDYEQVPYGSQHIRSLGAEAEEPGVFDIEGRAAAGARKAVKPMITGALVMGGAGLVLGGLALVVAIRR
jgi:hypothetical protein